MRDPFSEVKCEVSKKTVEQECQDGIFETIGSVLGTLTCFGAGLDLQSRQKWVVELAALFLSPFFYCRIGFLLIDCRD